MRGVIALGVLKEFVWETPGLAVGGESWRPLVRGRGGLAVVCGTTPLQVDNSVDVALGVWWGAEGGSEMTGTRTGDGGSGGITLTTFTGLSTLGNKRDVLTC